MYIEIKNKDGYNLLTKDKVCREDIEVKPVLQSKEVTESGEVTADAGFAGLEKVTVNVASGGASLNIAYGDTAPEDTTKLWVNGAEPSKVIATNKMNGSETLSLVNTTLPISVSYFACASVGTDIYIFGGHSTYSTSDKIYKFDTERKTFELLSTTLPNPICNMGCAAVGTNIYLFGGRQINNGSSTYYKTILKFDTQTYNIETLSSTVTLNTRMGCAAVGTDIYLIGGMLNDGNSSNNNYVQKFNTKTETLERLSAFNYTYAIDMGCVAIGTDIYLIGGKWGGTASSAIRKYDTLTQGDVVTTGLSLTNATSEVGCASVGTNIYCFGGFASSTSSTYYGYNTIQKIDIEKNTVELLSQTLSNAMAGVCCATVGSNIYALGGYSRTGTNNFNHYNTIYDFAVSVPLTANQLLLNTTLNKNLFKIINAESAEIEIGVNGVYRGNANGIAELESANVFDESQSAWVDVQSGVVVQKVGSAGFTVSMSSNGQTATVYDGQTATGTGVTIDYTTKNITCTSGYLLVTTGSANYVSGVGNITGDITGEEISYSGSGYNDRALLYTVKSDGSILNIGIYLD